MENLEQMPNNENEDERNSRVIALEQKVLEEIFLPDGQGDEKKIVEFITKDENARKAKLLRKITEKHLDDKDEEDDVVHHIVKDYQEELPKAA